MIFAESSFEYKRISSGSRPIQSNPQTFLASDRGPVAGRTRRRQPTLRRLRHLRLDLGAEPARAGRAPPGVQACVVAKQRPAHVAPRQLLSLPEIFHSDREVR